MAITGTLTIVDTDFSDALSGIVSACSPNVLRVTAALTGGTDVNAYCEVQVGLATTPVQGYEFKMVSKSFNGATGDFYFDFSSILEHFFLDTADDELLTGVQEVEDTCLQNTTYDFKMYVKLFDSVGNELDSLSYINSIYLFSSRQIGNVNGSNEIDWAAGQPPNFLAQVNRTSYIYYYGEGDIVFTKVDSIPSNFYMIDNLNQVMIDNNSSPMISNF